MRVNKIKQYGLSIGCLITLLVSPILGCTCHHDSHQVEKSEHAQPAPSHSHEVKEELHSYNHQAKAPHAHHDAPPAEHHQADESTSDEEVCFSLSEGECCCVKPVPEVFAKAEKFKFGNLVIAILLTSIIQTEFAPQLVAVNISPFIKPFYLTVSFYDISRGRAPPRF